MNVVIYVDDGCCGKKPRPEREVIIALAEKRAARFGRHRQGNKLEPIRNRIKNEKDADEFIRRNAEKKHSH